MGTNPMRRIRGLEVRRDPFGTFDRLLRNPWIFWPAALVIGVLGVIAVFVLARVFQGALASQRILTLVVLATVLFLLLNGAALCIFLERKVSAYIQDRRGPNRVGHLGLLQSAADGIKMLLKEDVIPGNVDKPLYLLAPAVAFGVAMLTFAVIPWAGNVRWPWMPADAPALSTQVASLDVGFLYIVAVASLGVYSVVLAGYASNNKYSFYGGMRAAAQMISYEIPLGLGLLCILLTAGTVRLDQVVAEQARSGLWYIFYQPLAFLLVLISGFAETNRAPFDLAEAEQELVGGYHTEYSALKFGLFFLGEYTHMMVGSALVIALFLGGWAPLPFVGLLADNDSWWAMLLRFGIYWGKIAAFIVFYMVVRWTLPRFRFDQLMQLAWQSLVPIGVGLMLVTSLLVVLGWHDSLPASLAGNLLVLVVALWHAARSRKPITGRQANLGPAPGVQVR